MIVPVYGIKEAALPRVESGAPGLDASRIGGGLGGMNGACGCD